MSLLDSSNAAVKYVTFDLVAGEESAPVILKPTPDGENTLASSTSAFVTLQAREHGTSDPYVDLPDGIDLSGYTPGTPVAFDVKAIAEPSVSGLKRIGLFLGSTRSTAANWLGPPV